MQRRTEDQGDKEMIPILPQELIQMLLMGMREKILHHTLNLLYLLSVYFVVP